MFAPLPVIGPLLPFGNYGVTFFFILSGFVLTWSAKPGTRPTTFWWRRFARIYPAHLFALLLAIPVFYHVTPDPSQWWVKPLSIGVLLLSVFLVQGWSNEPSILFSGNPAAWTLTCEAFFYALHPALYRLFRRFRARGALTITLTVVCAAFLFRVGVILFPESWLTALPLPITRVSEFIIGIGLAHAMRHGWLPRVKPIWCYIAGGALLVWLVLAARFGLADPLSRWVQLTANEWIIVVFSFTIVSIACRDIRGGRSLLRHPVLVKLGEWSFCFYLVHATIMYVFLAGFGAQAVSWTNVGWQALVFILALLLSWAMHSCLEKPVERRMRKWWDGRESSKNARHTQEQALSSSPGQ